MEQKTKQVVAILKDKGANLVGIGDITELPPEVRANLSIGICVAVKYPAKVIAGIIEFPTPEYFAWYRKLNEQLDELVSFGAKTLQKMGYTAIARTRAYIGDTDYATPLPHKTIATRAGVGWIGKSALLVTPGYGSMLRISSILTDAPLVPAEPINASRCGPCTLCTAACPAQAISGRKWTVGLKLDEFFNVAQCRSVARGRAKQYLGREMTICGKCIAVCPYTQRYLKAQAADQ